MEELEVEIKEIIDEVIDEESASVAVEESKPMEISEDAKKSEEELKKIAPVEENKALKTKSVNKKWLTALLFIAINLVAVLLTVVMEFIGDDHPTNIKKAWSIFMQNWGWGVSAIALVVIALIAESLKRFIFLNKTLNKKLPLISLSSAILCKYYDNITPLGAGGQPFEIYYLRKKGVPVGIASGVPLVSYALNKIAYVCVSLIAIIICGFGEVSLFIQIISIIGLIVNLLVPAAIFLFTIMPRLSTSIAKFVAKLAKKLHIVKDERAFEEKITGSIKEYAECIHYFLNKSKMSIVIGFLCSVVYFLAIYSLPFFVIKLCGTVDITWGRMFTYCVICYASVTLLPTPGGSGGAEVSFRSIFAKYILTDGMVIWGMLSWRVLGYYSFIAFGIILIIIQQILKFTKKVASGEIFEATHIKKEEPIPEEDQLELYSPIPPSVKTAEDDINTADPVILSETTIEESIPAEPIQEDAILDNAESVIEFTAVIESKSSVKITEEKIEVAEKVLNDKVQPINEKVENEDIETKPSLVEATEQNVHDTIDVTNQHTVEQLKQSTLIVEENTPNERVIHSTQSLEIAEDKIADIQTQATVEKLKQTTLIVEENHANETISHKEENHSLRENSSHPTPVCEEDVIEVHEAQISLFELANENLTTHSEKDDQIADNADQNTFDEEEIATTEEDPKE